MRTIIVVGMPRSGTSWLGQIVNSHPEVAFRTEPLFSYRFKNVISPDSTDLDIQNFFDVLLESGDDAFLMQQHHVDSGAYPNFLKVSPSCLAYKTSRHHELLERFLASKLDIHVVGIVRHPCGAINSWIHSQKEFLQKRCSVEQDWNSGTCRKDGVGEYWGFNDWLSTTKNFLALNERFRAFSLVRYSDLVRDPIGTSKVIFGEIGLRWNPQTEEFLGLSHSVHNDDPYAVYKSKDVNERWRRELDMVLIDEITERTIKHGLKQFLD